MQACLLSTLSAPINDVGVFMNMGTLAPWGLSFMNSCTRAQWKVYETILTARFTPFRNITKALPFIYKDASIWKSNCLFCKRLNLGWETHLDGWDKRLKETTATTKTYSRVDSW